MRARARASPCRPAGGRDSFESKQGQVGRTRDSHRRRRDNGSNELTRTPEPRLSLSSRSPPRRSAPDHRAPSVSLAPPPPPALLTPRKLFVLFLLHHHHHHHVAVESNPICHLRSFSPRLPSFPRPLSLAPRMRSARTRTLARSLSLSSPFLLLQGRSRGGQLPGASVLSTENKDGQSDYYENKST